MRQRFEVLDVLRGLAALAVVFWHWQHFYFDLATLSVPTAASSELLPLYQFLAPFYRYGDWGVDLFFLISGFVFFYLYLIPIRQGVVSGRAFFVLRFSRLYPLHLLTLLAVAGLQALYEVQAGAFFVYQDNGLWAFGRQLLFASNWAPWWPFSFNGPIWSVSFEVLLYLGFFVVARSPLTHPILIGCLAVAGLTFLSRLNRELGHAAFLFFLGGLCLHFVKSLRERYCIDWSTVAGFAIAIGASFAQQRQSHVPPLPVWTITTMAFPGLIITLACLEDALKRPSAYLSWLGNVSYSSYLIHFPLQLLTVTLSMYLGLTIDYSSSLTLALFMGTLIALSLLSFHYFEAPVQKRLRELLRVSKQRQAATLTRSPT
jgi:peptidoglycan/LPS O-acetylase OafA/YrhL